MGDTFHRQVCDVESVAHKNKENIMGKYSFDEYNSMRWEAVENGDVEMDSAFDERWNANQEVFIELSDELFAEGTKIDAKRAQAAYMTLKWDMELLSEYDIECLIELAVNKLNGKKYMAELKEKLRNKENDSEDLEREVQNDDDLASGEGR